MAVPRDNIDALTGLRFVAAFTIVLGHYHQAWLELSAIGMPLFFTLSGFIIHYVYAPSFADNRRRAVWQFAIARFSRIYPLYFVLLVWNIVHTEMGPALVRAANLPALLAFVGGCWTWWPFSVDGHPLLDWQYHLSWSVSTELFFYLAYALLLYRIAGIRSARLCLGLLGAFCLFAYLIFYGLFLSRESWDAVGLAYFPQFAHYAANFNQSFYRWLLYFSPYARLFEFIGGVLTAQVFLLVRRDRLLRARLRSLPLAWIGIAVMATLWSAFFYEGPRDHWLAVGNTAPSAFLVSLHMNFLLAPACYALLLALALGGSSIGRLLAAPIPRFLGDVSYSTYLSHMMAASLLIRLGVRITPTLPYLGVIVAVVYALSWLLYTIVEVPAKRVLRLLLNPAAPTPAIVRQARPRPAGDT